MRNVLTDYIPPILIKKLLLIARKIKIGGKEIQSYQDLDLVKLILFKNLQLRRAENLTNLEATSFLTIAAVGMAIKNKSIFSVLDFGGGAGHHQFLAKKFFKDVSFDWTVVETEAMSTAAQQGIKDEGLSFISSLSSIDKAKKFDLIYSNSAIQYTQDPLNTLRGLLNLDFGYFFITRVPLTTGSSQIVYLQESMLSQNGPGPAPYDFQEKWVKYENCIVSKDSFEKILNEALGSWISVDEGFWDSGRFGNRVKTFSYFGITKKVFNPH
jgi:putative methyltransferase (TIGR04325 family)